MTARDRRAFLREVGAATLGLAFAGCRAPRGGALASPAAPPELGPPAFEMPPVRALAAPLLPSPDLGDARILRFVAGLRPYRRGGVRLATERFGDRAVVHDYGHGGSGITLAWGCADDVLARVRGEAQPPARVAVIGAGVSGLACAHRLATAGFAVRVLAREFTPHTTSDVAGGQWAPSLVDVSSAPGERARFERWLRASHAAYSALVGERYGVFRRPNYTTRGAGGGLRDIPDGLFPAPERLARLPFAGGDRAGDVFQTFLIEPYRLLPALTRDLADLGATFEPAEFASLEEVLALEERVVVNTLGLGAAPIFDDAELEPIRGQLVLLEPQALPYLLSHRGYLFPRSDALVLGGTVERGERLAEPDPERCRAILDTHRRFFAGA